MPEPYDVYLGVKALIADQPIHVAIIDELLARADDPSMSFSQLDMDRMEYVVIHPHDDEEFLVELYDDHDNVIYQFLIEGGEV